MAGLPCNIIKIKDCPGNLICFFFMVSLFFLCVSWCLPRFPSYKIRKSRPWSNCTCFLSKNSGVGKCPWFFLFFPWHLPGGAGHQLTVVAYKHGQLYCMCTEAQDGRAIWGAGHQLAVLSCRAAGAGGGEESWIHATSELTVGKMPESLKTSPARTS